MSKTLGFWPLLVIFGFLDKGASLLCKDITVRINENVTIKCPIEGKADRFYWYLGPTSETKPILALDNGEKSGAKYKDGHYDITSKGEMEIINAQMEHEGIYTFVVIFSNRTSLQRDISVDIKGLAIPCRLKYSLTGGQNVTISCDVEGEIDQYKWYLETTSDTKPILTLRNGVKGGSMYDDNHYGITNKGEMEIIDAREKHEGNYTIVIVFRNGTEAEQTIILEILDDSNNELLTIVFIVLVVFTISTVVLAPVIYIIRRRCNRKGDRSRSKGKKKLQRRSRKNRSKNNYDQLQKMVTISKKKLSHEV